MNVPVLTIDGPSGAGKGTISRSVAKKLGWHYLDSGSIYRSLAIAVMKRNADLNDVHSIIGIAQSMQLEFECGDELIVRLSGTNITDELATETTGNTASIVAAIPEVRQTLLQKQKDFRQMPGLVADGRDMGTVVFCDAPCKVYLTASAEERANRRYKQLLERGKDVSLERITQEIKDRDKRDSERSTAPLKPAEDAVCIDSSELTIDEVIQKVMNLVELNQK